MNLLLPDSVATFFQVSNGGAPSSLVHAFAEHAVVHDEGQIHQGLTEIGTWLAAAQGKYTYHVKPLTAEPDACGITVVARYVGNFPGSPARLIHLFRFAGNKIAYLEIH